MGTVETSLLEWLERRVDLILIDHGPVSELRPITASGRRWIATNAPVCWGQKDLLPDRWLFSPDDEEDPERAVSAARGAGLKCVEWRVIKDAR